MAYANALALETISRFNAESLAGRVRVELIPNARVNAFASRAGPQSPDYIVGIHDALFVALDETVGSFATRMSLDAIDPDRRLGFREESYAVLERHAEAVIGRMVSQLSTYFVVLHEMAHIINGHLGLLHASGLSEEILEAYGRRAAPVEAIRLQAMEINADATATISWAGQLLSTSFHAEGELDPLARDLRFQFWGWFLAVGCTFMLLGFKRYDIEELSRLTHPPALMRVTMVADQTGRWMAKRFGGTVPDLIDLALDAYSHAQSRFHAGSPDPPVAPADHDPRALDHFMAIGRAWQTLGPSLEEYKHGGTFGRVVIRDD